MQTKEQKVFNEGVSFDRNKKTKINYSIRVIWIKER